MPDLMLKHCGLSECYAPYDWYLEFLVSNNHFPILKLFFFGWWDKHRGRNYFSVERCNVKQMFWGLGRERLFYVNVATWSV